MHVCSSSHSLAYRAPPSGHATCCYKRLIMCERRALFNSSTTMIDIQQLLKRHSLALNIATNVVLLLLCLVSYIIIFLIYFRQGDLIRSLVYVGEGALPPTTTIPLLGVLLTGATSALLTRAVEHGLWIDILDGQLSSQYARLLTDDEAYRRAQWSVSPFARLLLYSCSGASWLLRVSGLLLFCTAVLNPILLYGVTPTNRQLVATMDTTPSTSTFSGFVRSDAEAYSDGM